MDDIPSSREQHYWFAHRTLPQILFQNPAVFFAATMERDADPLRALWCWLGERLGPATASVERDALAGEVLRLEGVGLVALITLPPPRGLAEAYFAAAVYLQQSEEPPETITVRYVTLELTRSSPENPGPEPTMLGEWTVDGAHVNYGFGPAPTPEGFIEAVRALVLGLPPYDGPPVASVTPVPSG
jgi:hypothetical protein